MRDSTIFGNNAGTDGAWKTVEQPDLRQEIENAKSLPVESLGEPSRDVRRETLQRFSSRKNYSSRDVNETARMMVANPDGKSWDVIQWYFKDYRGPTWGYAIDTGTGEVTRLNFPDNVQLHYAGVTEGLDGKLYIVSPHYSSPTTLHLLVYDPATKTLENRGAFVEKVGGERRNLVTAADGLIYGTGQYNAGGKVTLYAYDPQLRKVVKHYGGIGPDHAPNIAYSVTIATDDTHVYVTSGFIPWYLVAVNRVTGEEKVLLEAPSGSDWPSVETAFPGCIARGWPLPGGGIGDYWIHHGRATVKTGDMPPWEPQAAPWDKPERVPPPECYLDQMTPDEQGNATFWYRTTEDKAKAPANPAPDANPGDLGWRAATLTNVDTFPLLIGRLTLLPGGKLLGHTLLDYLGYFLFDPKTDKGTRLGCNMDCEAFTHIVHDGKLYSGGYWLGTIYEYDPAKPWNLGSGGPPGNPAAEESSPASNPRRLGQFIDSARMTIPHDSAIGADGRIYFGGFGLRVYNGGGFGWYDPRTRQLDGFWKPLSGYAVSWLAAVNGGRQIVLSTTAMPDELNGDRVPESAKLLVFDTTEGRFVREIMPLAKAPTTGSIVEVAPGRLLGLTVDPERWPDDLPTQYAPRSPEPNDPPVPDTSILYGVDVSTGEVLFRRTLPWPVSKLRWFGEWAEDTGGLLRGPDGFYWTFLQDVLVRIDPKDTRVEVIGKLDPPSRPTFVGNDLYFTNSTQLRRIRNIVPSQ